MSSRIKFAVICASNQNRSMEAHHVLSKKGLDICSFGTGNNVKLPGTSADKPNVFAFGVPYDTMYKELDKQDHDLYTQNGVLHMLDRNRKIKTAPERFQDGIDSKDVDVIMTCEERCYDAVLEELMARGGVKGKPVHVVNFDIKDNHEDAAIGARLISQFTQILEEQHRDDFQDRFDEILEEFQTSRNVFLLHSVCYI